MDWGPVTGWLAGLIGISSLAYTLWNNHRQNLREISWIVAADTPLLTAPSPGWAKLKIMLGDTVVENPRFISVHLVNSGRVVLKPDDISVPPTVRFSDAQIMAASLDLHPCGDPEPDPCVHHVALPAMEFVTDKHLLNPGDKLIFQFLVDGKNNYLVTMQAAGFKTNWGTQFGTPTQRYGLLRTLRGLAGNQSSH